MSTQNTEHDDELGKKLKKADDFVMKGKYQLAFALYLLVLRDDPRNIKACEAIIEIFRHSSPTENQAIKVTNSFVFAFDKAVVEETKRVHQVNRALNLEIERLRNNIENSHRTLARMGL